MFQNYLNYFKLFISEIYHFVRPNFNRSKIIKKLNQDGIVAISEFFNKAECAQLIEKFNNLEPSVFVKLDNDKRLFFAENQIKEIKSIFDKKELNFIKKKYIGAFNVSSWMFNNTFFKKNSLGSGGDWHRDSALRRQLKFIVYLNDVTENNGPFQYILGSHKLSSKLYFSSKSNFDIGKTRFNVSEIPNNGKWQKVTGKKGTLIIVDTSGLHRGTPIVSGERYAITEYIFDFNLDKGYGK